MIRYKRMGLFLGLGLLLFAGTAASATIVSIDAEENAARRYMQYTSAQWLKVAFHTEPVTKEQASLLLLYQALLNPDPALMEITIAYGGDVNAYFTSEKEGMVPLIFIVVSEPKPASVVRFLLAHGANINVRMSLNPNMTLLMVASATSPYSDVIQVLLDAGADTNATHNGKTAYEFIQKNMSLRSSPVAERLRKQTRFP